MAGFQFEERWKHYIPALACLGGVLMVLLMPVFAVLFMVVGLTFVGGVYAYIVFQMHNVQDKAAKAGTPGSAAVPNFRNVTLSMMERLKWWREDLS